MLVSSINVILLVTATHLEFNFSRSFPRLFAESPPTMTPDTPTDAPTVAPSVASDPPTPEGTPDICEDYTFPNRRRLQDGGQGCDPNILETARTNPDLSTMVSLLELAGFDDVLQCAGPFTGFFPTNDAFEALDPEILVFLQNPDNIDALQGLLLYHFLGGVSTVAELEREPGEIDTLLTGEPILISLSATDGSILVNDASVIIPDVTACNGIIQVIDAVLLPLPGKCCIRVFLRQYTDHAVLFYWLNFLKHAIRFPICFRRRTDRISKRSSNHIPCPTWITNCGPCNRCTNITANFSTNWTINDFIPNTRDNRYSTK
jgi:uncharacterized surface protein with fasciclin (FAS1) repeats